MISKLTLLLLLASSTLASLNQDYAELLHGREVLTPLKIAQLYRDFQNEFKSTEAGLREDAFLESIHPNMNRQEVFTQALSKIIAHNSDPSYTYKVGVNSFTDFTEEEFQTYFHLNAP